MMKSTSPEQSVNKYDAIFYMRYGNSMYSWWKQDRRDHMATNMYGIKICMMN